MRWRGRRWCSQGASSAWVRPCTSVLSWMDSFATIFAKYIFYYLEIACSVGHIHVWMRATFLHCSKILAFFLQITSMGLKTTLLIVLTTICVITGNGARSKGYFSLCWLAPRSSSPTQKMCQRLGTDPNCCLTDPYDRCHMNVYLCKKMICLYLNVCACVHIPTYSCHIGVYTGSAQTVTTAKSG